MERTGKGCHWKSDGEGFQKGLEASSTAWNFSCGHSRWVNTVSSVYKNFTMMKNGDLLESRIEAGTSIEEAMTIGQVWEFKLSKSEDIEMVDIANWAYIQASLHLCGWAMQGIVCDHASVQLSQVREHFSFLCKSPLAPEWNKVCFLHH